MVEESTAATHSLAQETEELVRLVSKFRIGEAAKAATPVQARPAPRPAAASRPAPASTPVPTMRTYQPGGGAALKARPVEDGWEEF